MKIEAVEIVKHLSPEQFKAEFYRKKPVVIKNLSKKWPARDKWTWEYLIEAVGPKEVGLYGNERNSENMPVHSPHQKSTFPEYINGIVKEDWKMRLFLFNILEHAPEMLKDFSWPHDYFDGVLEKYPMLFAGGKGSVTHVHFDMDLSDVMQTQFIGKKRVLLFPFEQQHNIYRRPFEVMSLVDFTGYYEASFSEKLERFPALKNAEGVEAIIEHGDTLYMPSKWWHHMEYLETGIGLSLRSWQNNLKGKLNGLYHIFLMRHIDGAMKKNAPELWFNYKMKKIKKKESELLRSTVQ